MRAKMKRAAIMEFRNCSQERWETEGAGICFGFSSLKNWPLSGLRRFSTDTDPLVLGAAGVAGEKLVKLFDTGFDRALKKEIRLRIESPMRKPGKLEVRHSMMKDWQLPFELASNMAESRFWRREFTNWIQMKAANDRMWSKALVLRGRAKTERLGAEEARAGAARMSESKRRLHQLIQAKIDMVCKAKETCKYSPKFVFGGMLRPVNSVSQLD